MGTSHSATVSGLPTTGTIYVRYWTRFSSGWKFQDHTYTMRVSPAAPTLLSPSGTIYDSTPTYSWQAVPTATWYYLYVYDSTARKIGQWYRASNLWCGTGRGTCTVTPTTSVGIGTKYWKVRAYNGKYGPFSNIQSFRVFGFGK